MSKLHIVLLPCVFQVSFTGSTSVGKHVGTMAADVLKPVTLELGGKSPVVVTPGVDINEAAEVSM